MGQRLKVEELSRQRLKLWETEVGDVRVRGTGVKMLLLSAPFRSWSQDEEERSIGSSQLVLLTLEGADEMRK